MRFLLAMQKSIICLVVDLIFFSFPMIAQTQSTYAEKLGWKPGEKIMIMHIDDAGMSYDSNRGAIRAMEEGIANSVSIMMPCPGTIPFIRYVQTHPQVDAGLHLTLTSEWQNYRWEPLAGPTVVPGLIDQEGAFWPTVEEVVAHASPDEIEKEIRSQIERALDMGFHPTHLDSHMGTLFATDAFIERYIKVGAEYNIPIMFPGGHNTLLEQGYRDEAIARLKSAGQYKEGMEIPMPEAVQKARAAGQQVWDAGLPVLDDLHIVSLSWTLPESSPQTEEHIRELKVQKFIAAFEQMQPGITMFIVHCTDPTAVFKYISGSGLSRLGDLLAMMDPRLKAFVEENKIQLTTWRELKERRAQVSK